MPDFQIKANDTLPVIEATLSFEGESGTPMPSLIGTQVTFVMRRLDGIAPMFKKPAVVLSADRVRYAWEPGDTSVPGSYVAEWEVVFPDLGKQTFPGDSYHEVDIVADLDEV